MGTLPRSHCTMTSLRHGASSVAGFSREPLFVFGSLLDEDILGIVLGRNASARLEREPAVVRGYQRRRVCGEPFPMLIPHAEDGSVDGTLLHGLDGHAWARLRFYEGPGYALHPVMVDAGRERRRRSRARVFLSTERLRDSGHGWDLDHWQRTEKPLAVLLAQDLMALYGSTGPDGPPDDVWDEIKTRCRARLDRSATLHARGNGA